MRGPDWDYLEHLGKRRRLDTGLYCALALVIAGLIALVVAIWRQ